MVHDHKAGIKAYEQDMQMPRADSDSSFGEDGFFNGGRSKSPTRELVK